jgi:hypothetical protein
MVINAKWKNRAERVIGIAVCVCVCVCVCVRAHARPGRWLTHYHEVCEGWVSCGDINRLKSMLRWILMVSRKIMDNGMEWEAGNLVGWALARSTHSPLFIPVKGDMEENMGRGFLSLITGSWWAYLLSPSFSFWWQDKHGDCKCWSLESQAWQLWMRRRMRRRGRTSPCFFGT